MFYFHLILAAFLLDPSLLPADEAPLPEKALCVVCALKNGESEFEKIKAIILEKSTYNVAKVAKLLAITPKHMTNNIIRNIDEFKRHMKWFRTVFIKGHPKYAAGGNSQGDFRRFTPDLTLNKFLQIPPFVHSAFLSLAA